MNATSSFVNNSNDQEILKYTVALIDEDLRDDVVPLMGYSRRSINQPFKTDLGIAEAD